MSVRSFWGPIDPPTPRWGTMQQDLAAQVTVVGGGITGVTLALLLAEAGVDVVLLEARRVAGGTTGWSTGNLYVSTGPYLHKIADVRSVETMVKIARARAWAIDFIEKQVLTRGLHCWFRRRPWVLATWDESNVKAVEAEERALVQAGYPAAPIAAIPGLPRMPLRATHLEHHSARMNPLLYVRGMAEQAVAAGARFYEGVTVKKVDEQDHHVELTTDLGVVIAEHAVLATHLPLGVHPVQVVAAPHRSYAVAVKLRHPVPDVSLWEQGEAYHAYSGHPSDGGEVDRLILAGEHHKTGHPGTSGHENHYAALISKLQQDYPNAEVTDRWSAQHYRSGDLCPYIGPSTGASKRVFMATGFYADGLVYGTVAAHMLAEQVQGRCTEWDEAFDSTRGPGAPGLKEAVTQGIDMVAQLVGLGKSPPEADSFSQVLPGAGAVVEVGGERLAVHREDTGRLHIVSAVCTHMKCQVLWNESERSWDCPCHGSRFMPDGSIIEGPATEPLPVKERIGPP